MRNKRIELGVFAAMLFVTGASMAAEPGFYVAASLGQAEEDPAGHNRNFASGAPPAGIISLAPESIEVDSGDTSWSLAVGYQVNRYLAFEVEYLDFGTTDIAETYDLNALFPPFPAQFTAEYSSQVSGPALSVLGMLPVSASVDLYLRGGALFAAREVGTPDESFANTVWLAGAGIRWSFADRWALRAEYQKTGTLDETFLAGETELERLSLSALFRF